MPTLRIDPFSYPQEEIDPGTGLLNQESKPDSDVLKINPFSERMGSNVLPLGQQGFSKYDVDINRHNIHKLEKFRGERQPWAAQLGNAIAQAAVGEIVGGTIEGVGWLFALDDTNKLLQGEEVELGNFLTDIGKSLREGVEEAAPIYTTFQPGTFSPGKWSWWMSNAPSIASTISLMLPAMGVVKGVSMLGKMLGITRKLGMGAKTAGWATAIGQATISRHMEGLMEASQKWDEIYERGKRSGMSDQEAKENASIAASDIYKKDWLLLGQDILSYKILGSSFGKLSQKAGAAATKAAGFSGVKPTIRKSGALLLDAIGEGGEEGYQYVVSERADELAKNRVDPNYKIRGVDDIMKDGDFWTSVTFGALGAGLFQTLGRKINKAVMGSKSPEVQKEKAQMDNVLSWGPTLKHYYASISELENAGAIEEAEALRQDLVEELKSKAASVGNLNLFREWVESITKEDVTEEDLAKFDMDMADREVLRKLFPDDIVSEFKEFEDRFNHYMSDEGGQYDDDIAGNLVRTDLIKDRLLKRKKNLEEKLTEQESLINDVSVQIDSKKPGDVVTLKREHLSEKGKEAFEIDANVNAWKRKRSALKNILNKKKELTDTKGVVYKAEVKLLDSIIRSQENKRKTLKLTRNDNKILTAIKEAQGGKLFGKYNKTQSEVEFVNTTLKEKETFHKWLEDQQKKRKEKRQEGTGRRTEPKTSEKEYQAQLNAMASRIEDGLEPAVSKKDKVFYEENKDKIDEILLDREKEREILETLDEINEQKVGEYLRDGEEMMVNDLRRMTPDRPYIGELRREGDDYIFKQRETGEDEYLTFKPDMSFTENELQVVHPRQPIERPTSPEQPGSELDVIDPETEGGEVVDDTNVEFEEGTIDLEYLRDDKELETWMTNPENTLDNSTLTFDIIWEYEAFWKENPELAEKLKKIQKGELSLKSLKVEEIKKIPIGGGIFAVPGAFFIQPTDKIVASEKLAEEDKGKKNIPLPSKIKGLSSKVERDKATKSYLKSYKSNQTKQRRFIIENILQGNTVTITALSKTKGLINSKNNEGTPYSNDTLRNALNILDEDINLAFGMSDGRIKDHNGKYAGLQRGLGGNVYLVTNRTSNGDPMIIKLNPQKISLEHADIIYDVLRDTLSNKTEGGFLTVYKKTGLSNGEILRLLVYHGDDTKIEKTDKKRDYLRKKQLYFKGNNIYYDVDGKINVDHAGEKDINKFKQWLRKNKNYSIDQTKLLKKTKKAERKFLNVEDKKGLTYEQMIVRAGHLMTTARIREDAGGAYTRKPLLKADLRTTNIKVEKPSAKVTDKERSSIEEQREKDLNSPVDQTYDPIFGIKYELSMANGNFSIWVDPEDPIGVNMYDQGVESLKKAINLKYDRQLEELENKGKEKKIQNKPDKKVKNPDIKEEDQNKVDDVIDEMFPGFDRPYNGKIEYEVQDLDQEMSHINMRLNNVSTHLHNSIIRYIKDGGTKESFARVINASIHLFEKAEVGTAYHEAFHIVSLFYLTKEQRQALYDNAREEYKELRNEKDETVIEEFLAEKFREYVLSDEIVKPEHRKINGVFHRILEAIKSFVARIRGRDKVSDLTVEKLFNKIERGDYRKAKIDKPSYQKFYNRPYDRISEKFTQEQVGDITILIQYLLVTENNLYYKESLNKPFSYSKVEEALTKTRDKLKTLEGDAARQTEDLYNRILEDFDEFKRLTEDRLLAMNIRRRTQGRFDYLTGEEILNYDKASYEINSRDNSLANVKLFFATLPSGEKRNTFTRAPQLVDFGTAWSRLLKDTWHAGSYDEMIRILERKAERSKFYDVLLNGSVDPKTGETLRPGLLNAPRSFKTQVYITLDKYRHEFYNLVKRDNDYKAYSAGIFSAEEEVTKIWAQTFANKTEFYNEKGKFSSSEVTKIKNKFLRKVRDPIYAEYEDQRESVSFEDFAKYRDEIIGLLAEVGITIDKETLENITEDLSPENKDQGLYILVADYLDYIFAHKNSVLQNISDKRYKEYPIDQQLNQESKVKDLAKLAVKVNDDYIADTVFGADGATFFVYSQPSFLSDFNKYVNANDKKHLRELTNVIYNVNSEFLRQINGGKTLEIVTMSSYRDGRKNEGYSDLDPRKDFLLKMHMINNGFLGMPTLADKKPYFFYKGLDLIKFDSYRLNEQGELVIPEDIVDMFEGYYQDEFNRIKQVKKDISKAIESRDKDKNSSWHRNLRQGIHYKDKNDKGEPILENADANGLKYHVFPEFNEKRYSRKALVKSIRERIEETTEKAREHGIISYNTDNKGNRLSIRNNQGSVSKALIKKYVFQNNPGRDKALPIKAKEENQALQLILAEYTLNTQMSVIETGKILLMDPAFYKANDQGSTIQDMVKRVSGLIAPGEKTRDDFKDDDLKRKTYKVFTIQDHIEDIKEHNKPLYDKLLKSFVKLGLTQGEAERRLSGYNEINVADAQTYVTPQLYKEIRERLGEWTPQDTEAFDLLMSGKKLTKEEQKKVNALSLQPLKTVYFGVDFQDRLGIPIYDKMSMAILLPEMTYSIGKNKKTGKEVKVYNELKPLYDKMINDKVDMVKFESAVKVGGTSSIKYLDNEGKVNQEYLDNNVEVYEQEFKYLRRQQVTDPHSTEVRLLASQVKKIIMSNLRLDKKIYKVNGKTYNGKQLAEEINNAYSELSNRGLSELNEKLGLRPNGTIDFERFYQTLKESAENAGMPYQVIDALNYEEGKEMINIDTFPDRKWIEGRIISLVNKFTIDIMTPGDQYIQMSNFGMRDALGKKLKLLDAKGRTEIMVSPELFKNIIPNYEDATLEEMRSWLRGLENGLEGLGYRIPTQGPNSVIPFVVKDFLSIQTKNVVVLPSEFTALTDADFDIDKLFLATYNYYTNISGKIQKREFIGEGKINDTVQLERIWQQRYADDFLLREQLKEIKDKTNLPDKLKDKFNPTERSYLIRKLMEVEELLSNFDIDNVKPYQVNDLIEQLENVPSIGEFVKKNKGKKTALELNDVRAIQDRTIDLMRAPLLSKDHLVENKTPLSTHTDNIKNIVKELREIRGEKGTFKNLEAFSPTYQNLVKQAYLGGKDGVAPSAVNNVHHVLGQLYGLGIITDQYDFANYSEEGYVDLSQPIGKDGVYILDWLSALISAHVDIAKDAYIFDLNVNKNTYSVVNYLIRAGVGANTFWYLVQPGMLEYTATTEKNEKNRILVKYQREIDRLAKEKNISEEKVDALIDEASDPEVIFSLKKEDFKKQIAKEERDLAWYITQLGMMRAFERKVEVDGKIVTKGLNADAGLLGLTIAASGIDRKKYGTNMLDIKSSLNLLEKVKTEPKIVGFNRMMDESFLGTLKKNSVDILNQKIFRDIMINSSPVVEGIFNDLYKLIPERSSKALTDKDKKDLAGAIFAAIAAKYFTGLKGYGLSQKDIKNLFRGKSSVGLRLIEARRKHPELENNIFIQHLKVEYNGKDKVYHVKGITGDKNDKWQRDSIVIDWKKLLNDPNDEIRKLAEDLVVMSFYSSGFNRGLYTFHHNIPINHLTQKGLSSSYNEFIGDMKTDLNGTNLMVDYVDDIKSDVISNNSDLFILDNYAGPREIYNLEGKKGGDIQVVVLPTFEGSFIGLQLEGVNAKFMGESEAGVIYKIIPEKGTEYKGHRITEYGYSKDESFLNPKKTLSDEKFIELLETKKIGRGFEAAEEGVVITKGELLEDYSQKTRETMEKEVASKGVAFKEDPSTGYKGRTMKNASADATIAIAADFNSAGEKLTKNSVISQGKKYIPVNAENLEVTEEKINTIATLLKDTNSYSFDKDNNKVLSLNIAGNGIYTLRNYNNYTQQEIDDFTYKLLDGVVKKLAKSVSPITIGSIRTGGQTGFDEAGAKAGMKLGIPTLILAPKGWKFRNRKGQDISNETAFKERFIEKPSTMTNKQMNMDFEGQFDKVLSGEKTQTTRENKNNYKIGDIITIKNNNTGESIPARVTYVDSVNIEQLVDKMKVGSPYLQMEGRGDQNGLSWFVKNTAYLKNKKNVASIGFTTDVKTEEFASTPFLSDKQADLVKQIPLGLDPSHVDQINAHIQSGNLKEAKGLIDSFKEC